ncbi:hypothetical protein L1987_02682 [Smallanthus sonchifolius]|uniref:Uncharacterized protein n=1 Tax=Smallanthus sonchifolius TaxID=185202 RepID=A0ACB9K8N3_9ASTR|nr:hypothetical protein L1987_02682 [Smallanthus sonchifolius]
MKMLWLWSSFLCAMSMAITATARSTSHRLLLDTDVDTDDLFAILYLLKLNRSEFNLQAITLNTNSWSNAGHATNHIYDILYMMGRDDIDVGVGGEGGILENGTILPDVGGYLPIIDEGSRRYSPLRQPTAQQILIKTISEGPVTVFIAGAHTNLAIFLMTNPNLKTNIDHIYIMGGAVRLNKPNDNHSNMFTTVRSNPYAEFNFFMDPSAAYQVIHSGIPITLVPLDATNTIPITGEFFEAFEKNQRTYEAQYAFKSLKMALDTWSHDSFRNYFMWDSFMAGVATSAMRNIHKEREENEFAEMMYMNITVITSNEPYGLSDGSNPLFDDRKIPRFNLRKNGVHSGHVQTGIRDPFCLRENRTGICKDGYTEEVTGPDSARVRVATRAKPNHDNRSFLDKDYFVSFLDVLNRPQHQGRFNFTSQFPYYKQVFYKPDLEGKILGKIVVFDMDMSVGDFLALFYLLKVPVEEIYLKAILVTGSGWANAATIDVVYDVLHMMGRDDIDVGLGDSFGLNQSYPHDPNVGDCKYSKAIPHGSGGRLDTDTFYGLARDLPRSSRRYTSVNSIEFGAPCDTDFPQPKQPSALQVWRSLVKTIDDGSRVTFLSNGPLKNLANILLSDTNSSSIIKEVFILGGHINYKNNQQKGNVINVPSNKYAELNMFLDPLSAKTVFDSSLDITLIPLHMQHKVYAFSEIIKRLQAKSMTPEASFIRRLLTRLHLLQQKHQSYRHVDMFLGEILGVIIATNDQKVLNSTFKTEHLKVYAEGRLSRDGEINLDTRKKKGIKVLQGFNHASCYDIFVDQLVRWKQSAVIGSFIEQKRLWASRENRRRHNLLVF